MTGVKRQNTVVETTSAVHPTQSGSSGISGLVLFCFWWCCSCVYVCGNIDTGIDSSSMLTDTWQMSIQTSKVHLTLWSQIQSTLPSPKESTIQFNRTYHLPTTRPQTGDSQRPTVAIINAIAQNYLIMQLSLYSLIDSLFELKFFLVHLAITCLWYHIGWNASCIHQYFYWNFRWSATVLNTVSLYRHYTYPSIFWCWAVMSITWMLVSLFQH